MRRRDFVKATAGWAATWPLAARAQQSDKLPTIGFMAATSLAAIDNFIAAFVRRLHELGWVEGRTAAIEYRAAGGSVEHMAEIAAEFVRLKVDVIVTQGNVPTAVARKATTVIPIVFGLAGDPVGTGLVASLARPGGNVTGLSLEQPETSAKRLELLREVVPDLRKVAIMANAENPVNVRELPDVQDAARSLGLDAVIVEIRSADDIAPALSGLKSRADALYVLGDIVLYANRTAIISWAVSAKLPTIAPQPGYTAAGGLLSYGPDTVDMFRRAADYVDKILHGAKPADLPVEQPNKFELVINLKCAKALGLSIPQTLLATADKVIE